MPLAPLDTNDNVFFCDRCAAQLLPGTGDHFKIDIEAAADPSPPVISANVADAGNLDQRIRRILRNMEGISAQEAMDQIHRRVTLYLCIECYRAWIENPVGT